MKPITKLILAAYAAAALVPAVAMAQNQHSAGNQGYLVDARGHAVRSGSGLCWEHRDPDSPIVDPSCYPPIPPVAAAPAPAAIAPAAAAAKKISFSGDALFAFDKSVLKPEGEAMLDDLVRQLNGAAFDTILVTGHTDRFGSNAYNQKLSERRAETVKNFLVGRNVQANRIDASGKGETQPATKAEDCRGAKSAKVVACLQPDRRVDVEMTGTQTLSSSR